jgi:hypothetical protein
MPVRDALPFLDEAVASILGQSFGDFEFVILDDFSSDGSSERLREWAARDGRIRLIRSDSPLGPVGSSRAAVEASAAPLVARMDADDVAHPDRLRRQVELFEAKPEAGMAGTLHSLIDEAGKRLRGRELWPLTQARPVPPVTHGSIMFRRAVFDRAGGYREGSQYWEDVDLYLRLSAAGAVYIIPDALCAVRFSRTSTRPSAPQQALEEAYDAMHRRLRTSRGARARPARGIVPDAFITIATPRLWAGMPPRILGALVKRGALRPDRASLRALAWGAWAELSPGTLRRALSAAARRREQLAPKALAEARWLRWRPMQPCRADDGAA